MKNFKCNLLGYNWVRGSMDGFKFEAKIYTEPSEFGINNGRVSKLWIYDLDNEEAVITYERGWDAGENLKSIWEPVVVKLEKFAQRKDFKAKFSN